MGSFFFDESIHERAGLILGAFVYAPRSVADLVNRALQKCGLSPGTDEFKSSARMDNSPKLIRLRGYLLHIVSHETRIAVLICPAVERSLLWREGIHALNRIIDANRLQNIRHEAYFDERIVTNLLAAESLVRQLEIDATCTCHFEQNSKSVPGLQLADLVAHTCSTMLLEQMGLISKLVKVGPNSGYDPNLEVGLGWDLWTGVRYSFFHGGNSYTVKDDPLNFMTVSVSGFGLFIASSCNDELWAAGESRFGQCYLGCIH
jgi:hypothetical protein